MRELYKAVEIPVNGEDKKFRIKKMNAFDGSILLKIVAEKFLPVLQEIANTPDENGEELEEIAVLKLIPVLLGKISEDEMRRLMHMCLKTCEMEFPAGWQQVVDSKGNFGVEDLEYDAEACVLLSYQVITFNCSGFFGGSGSSSPQEKPDGSPRKQKT